MELQQFRILDCLVTVPRSWRLFPSNLESVIRRRRRSLVTHPHSLSVEMKASHRQTTLAHLQTVESGGRDCRKLLSLWLLYFYLTKNTSLSPALLPLFLSTIINTFIFLFRTPPEHSQLDHPPCVRKGKKSTYDKSSGVSGGGRDGG